MFARNIKQKGNAGMSQTPIYDQLKAEFDALRSHRVNADPEPIGSIVAETIIKMGEGKPLFITPDELELAPADAGDDEVFMAPWPKVMPLHQKDEAPPQE